MAQTHNEDSGIDDECWDFPKEPIGGGNPYQRCSSCKRSVPEINYRLSGHLSDCEWANKQNKTIWKKDHPKISAYYWAVPKDERDWLDGTPEIVYVYFDGKWSVFRPGMKEASKFEDFLAWSGPIDRPPEYNT